MAFFYCLFSMLVVAQEEEPRPRHPLAPSLPLLTKAEEAKVQKVLDRFIKYDIGELKGAEGKKALDDFHQLGPETIFILIEAFNRAAAMGASCPTVIIGQKIARILNGSEDIELLAFARENIGAGLDARNKYLGHARDLKVGALLRHNLVQQKQTAARMAAQKILATMSTADLAVAAAKEKGLPLQWTLAELERRQGPEVLDTLARAASSQEIATQKVAKGLLNQHLGRQSPTVLKDLFKHERPEVRAALAQVVVSKNFRWGSELIDLLEDNDPRVHQSAHKALVRLARGIDHGPASPGERHDAIQRWRAWWDKQKQR